MKKIVICAFLLGMFIVTLGLTACHSYQNHNINGINAAKVIGIKLIVYDENNKVIDKISSVDSVDNTSLSFNVNKRYIVEVESIQSGESDSGNIVADAIIWNFNNEVINVKKCNDDETDTTYFIECKKINEDTNLDIQVDEFSLKLNVCFEDYNICGHIDKISIIDSFVANAGYCSDDDLVEESLNFEKFGSMKQEHLIIYKFDSLTEFEKFKLKYQNRISFEELENKVNFEDESYFVNASLLLVYKFTTNTSLSYDVCGVYVDNKTLCVHVNKNITSSDNSKMKDGWFLAILVEKEIIKDITNFDSIMEE